MSHVEDNVIYLNCDFSHYLINADTLLNSLRYAKCIVNKRVQFRQCVCTSIHRASFHSVLVKHFGNRSLFHYLRNGDENELDYFKVDIRINFSAFDICDVITAYHKVRILKDELVNARNEIVINPFLSATDFEDFDTSDSDTDL